MQGTEKGSDLVKTDSGLVRWSSGTDTPMLCSAVSVTYTYQGGGHQMVCVPGTQQTHALLAAPKSCITPWAIHLFTCWPCPGSLARDPDTIPRHGCQAGVPTCLCAEASLGQARMFILGLSPKSLSLSTGLGICRFNKHLGKVFLFFLQQQLPFL